MYILNRQIKVIRNERFYLLSLKLSAVNFIIVFHTTTCNQSCVFTFVNIQADHVTLRVRHTNYGLRQTASIVYVKC